MKTEIFRIRERCAEARSLIKRAREQDFAVGAFNIDNQETLIAAANAAKVKNAPIMVEVSASEVRAMGMKNIRDMVTNYAEEFGVDLYINLDHSPDVVECKKAIDYGYEFIHIDISQANHDAPADEIIAATKEVVEYAKYTGALVESEPHYFAGGSNVHKEKIDYDAIKDTFSTPEGANEFVEATGIDTLAVAIGNLHGKYPVPKQLDIDLLARIEEALPHTNFSLHGGSGTPGHYYQAAVKHGVGKININSDLRFTFRQTLEEVLKENPDQYAVVKLMPTVIEAVQKVVEEKIELFGATGKALR